VRLPFWITGFQMRVEGSLGDVKEPLTRIALAALRASSSLSISLARSCGFTQISSVAAAKRLIGVKVGPNPVDDRLDPRLCFRLSLSDG
jgi:hypothetical protein